MLSVGNRFPMFDLTGIGTTEEFINVSTGDIANGWAVVYFYPKDFTFICPTEIKAICHPAKPNGASSLIG